ncbi:hypothetical protein [Nocardia blacklockiae]|uniref:hypothetical protein n=1 Tax=Nocardia blacklockiae TaxID=480036 RepID=UPI0018931C5C|nr:hypothetical protein [Nocardia blacklockiae]MBF6172726.1 hypothetical protein [Nocardia blacklockiae]
MKVDFGFRVLIASLAVMVSAACTVDDSSDPGPKEISPYLAPAGIARVTSMWEAEDGLDLRAEREELVRGAAEAEFITHAEQPSNAYYGYQEAVTESTGAHVGSAIGRRLLTGTLHWRLMSVTPTPSGFEGTTCLQAAGVSGILDSNQYTLWRIGTITSSRFEFTTKKPSETTPTPSIRQSNPATPLSEGNLWQAPRGDIFSKWKIRVANSTPSDNDNCRKWAHTLYPLPPNTHEDGSLYGIRTTAAPPVLPAYPGWPQ